LTLRASARQAGGLADDEAGRLERSGEAGESLGRVGDRVGAAAGGVEHDDCGFTDVASDEPRGRGGVRHLRLSSYELGIVCGRASGDGGPFNSSSVQGKREDGPDDGGLRAPSRDGQSPRAPIRAAARIGASHLQGQPLLLELQETIARSCGRKSCATEAIKILKSLACVNCRGARRSRRAAWEASSGSGRSPLIGPCRRRRAA
jgi:hypothetical protein